MTTLKGVRHRLSPIPCDGHVRLLRMYECDNEHADCHSRIKEDQIDVPTLLTVWRNIFRKAKRPLRVLMVQWHASGCGPLAISETPPKKEHLPRTPPAPSTPHACHCHPSSLLHSLHAVFLLCLLCPCPCPFPSRLIPIAFPISRASSPAVGLSSFVLFVARDDAPPRAPRRLTCDTTTVSRPASPSAFRIRYAPRRDVDNSP